MKQVVVWLIEKSGTDRYAVNYRLGTSIIDVDPSSEGGKKIMARLKEYRQ